ncbi:MAG TPA: FtsX-like permease family protein, partial [Gemmatimonadaceae bacterium]|nr:FtsX-like permease family protein [Gemmatimonadaceae bacterium]
IFLRGRVASDVDEHVRAIVQSINAALPVFDATTLDDIVQASLAGRRFAMEMLAAFALTALLLAGVGIYGVISYTVGQRSHEIGVRVALGALPTDVARLVLREGARLAVTGTVIGLGTALAVTRWLSGLLYGIGPRDPLTFAGVTVLLTAIALVACYAPARRAADVDPAIALRSSTS